MSELDVLKFNAAMVTDNGFDRLENTKKRGTDALIAFST